MKEFTIMFFACSIQAAEHGAVDLFLPACLLALITDGGERKNAGVFAPLHCERRAYFFKRGLLRIISDCVVDQVAAILAFARVCEID